MGLVNKVPGINLVEITIPGRILPTGEPIPGNVSAGPNLPLLGLAIGGPSVDPNKRRPAFWPKFPAEPPTNGYCTNGWLLNGRKSALPTRLPEFGPEGANTIAGPLQKPAVPQRPTFGRKKLDRFCGLLTLIPR